MMKIIKLLYFLIFVYLFVINLFSFISPSVPLIKSRVNSILIYEICDLLLTIISGMIVFSFINLKKEKLVSNLLLISLVLMIIEIFFVEIYTNFNHSLLTETTNGGIIGFVIILSYLLLRKKIKR